MCDAQPISILGGEGEKGEWEKGNKKPLTFSPKPILSSKRYPL
ncbi:hypothetical protein FDUTEX481_01420 [Tolypothrix sp. PCC 7601]|nr:hypothetical protein FDUTEX481_01420 [Tolypothrix sp. PCC 7601]